ncbi:DUF3311 domain-containing protein [Natronosalvus vescus]|uniref:DUF3311 domain-containing protein n=1 Tax=Natronosalvus vescus TaxID=2953881 RepID=UPI0020911E47|nr:DUF3311 domain-containing protein [Natronosalvus vescus]
MDWVERAGWGIIATIICLLGIPWFLWGDSTIVLGLPLWLWWHVGWLLLASALFWVFAQRYWGVGIEPAGGMSAKNSPRADGEGGTGGEARGDRR